jgi:hypothetical protein
MPISRPKPLSPQPSTSSANGVNLSPGLPINMEEEQSNSSSEWTTYVQFFLVKRDTTNSLLSNVWHLIVKLAVFHVNTGCGVVLKNISLVI